MYRLPPFQLKEADLRTLSQSPDWSLGEYKIPSQWKGGDGSGVKVAILDTGVQLDHPDLQNKIVETRDFTSSRFGVNDRFDHGTWCAGMVAAENNEFGVVGVAPGADLYIGKVIGDSGAGSARDLIEGILWAKAQKCQLVVTSLGSLISNEQLHQAVIEFTKTPEHFLVAAAGNEGMLIGNTINFPAKWKESTSVGAVDRNGKRLPTSSQGEELDVMAPGENMLSTITGSTYGLMTGTSMAAPFVAGVLALALSQGIQLGDYHDLREHLKSISDDMCKVGHDDQTGWGLINPTSLLNRNYYTQSVQEVRFGDLIYSYPVTYKGRIGTHIGPDNERK